MRLSGLDDDTLYESKLRSPAQIERELPKKEREVIGDLSEKPITGVELVPVDDSRPAVNVASGFEVTEIGDR